MQRGVPALGDAHVVRQRGFVALGGQIWSGGAPEEKGGPRRKKEEAGGSRRPQEAAIGPRRRQEAEGGPRRLLRCPCRAICVIWTTGFR